MTTVKIDTRNTRHISTGRVGKTAVPVTTAVRVRMMLAEQTDQKDQEVAIVVRAETV